MQRTAYEVRISDWSSDVCSSDLRQLRRMGRMGDPHVQLVALGEHVEAVAAIGCGAGDVTNTVAGGNRVHESAMELGAVGVAHGAVDDSADGHVHVVRGGCPADGHDLSLGAVTSVAHEIGRAHV